MVCGYIRLVKNGLPVGKVYYNIGKNNEMRFITNIPEEEGINISHHPIKNESPIYQLLEKFGQTAMEKDSLEKRLTEIEAVLASISKDVTSII